MRVPVGTGPFVAMLKVSSTALSPPAFLSSVGRVFACFDQQDSGNVSFGVDTGGARHFVKTAGDPQVARDVLPSHAARRALLANAERLARSVVHPAMTRFETSIESRWGRMLVYEWADGELLYAPRVRRDDPDTARHRFLALPIEKRIAAVSSIVELHVALAAEGWVAGDFYDGCLIYDFGTEALHVCDLDGYHRGPYRNTMGRMFGSDRFMAPEEFERGRTIDERTMVFALGRTIAIFLGAVAADVAEVACAADPERRYPSVAALAAALAAAVGAP